MEAQTESATESTATAETSYATREPYVASLEVDIQTEDAVNIYIEELDSGETVLNRTYTAAGTVDFDRFFEESTQYQVRIRTNGTEQWNQSVQDYEGYDLRVGSDGTVTVVSLYER